MKGYIYQGLGNSFIITMHLPKTNYSLLVQRLCLKYQLDGLITFNQKNNKMRIYNKDGSLANMCGNGIRCLTNFIYELSGNVGSEMHEEISSGQISMSLIKPI